jgi:8-oxo-dGTP diphosphatase
MLARFPVAVHVVFWRGEEVQLRVVGVMHRKSDDERIDFFLSYAIGGEEPRIAEPHKSSELGWAKRSDLPRATIPHVPRALEAFGERGWFLEFGW